MSLNPGLRPDRKFLASSAPNWPIRTEGLPLGLYYGARGAEPAAATVENRKFSILGLSSDRDVIMPGRQTHHLQPDIELIRPEPRRGAVRSGLSRDRFRHAYRLIHCVLH